MKHLCHLLCIVALLAGVACGKKETPPTPASQVQAPAPAQPDTTQMVKETAPKPGPVKVVELPKGSFTIQVAAWGTREDAEKLASFYKNKGYDSRMEVAQLPSGTWYRVRIGVYNSYRDALKVAEVIQDKYKSDVWLVKL